MLEGVGGLDIDIAGSGNTLQSLMSSLVGQGQFAFDDSVLKGVNLTELGAAASTALTTKKFSTSAFSSTAQTNFNALNAGFAMKEGVAVLTGMKIDAGTMTIDAGGALDIGRQELSLNLFPIFADKKAGLNGYGLPLKLSGGWGGVKFAPDWGFLADKATAGAKAKVQSEIQDELKGISDGLLGKLGLGSPKPAATPPPATPTTEPATPAQPANAPAATPAAPVEKPQSVEERLKAEAQKKLKGLFGGN
jgi:AsmA protein